MKGPAVLAGIGLALVLAAAAIGTPADADLWGHITFGRDIVASGQIIQADPYAFTSDRPWVNHEWLSEIVFAETYRLAGSPGLVAFKVLMIAALLALVWKEASRLSASRAVAAWLAILVFVGTFWRMHTIRPQLFSVLFFAIVLLVMTRADRGQTKGLWLLPPLMALWVNLHGGWIVGLGILGLWTAARMFDFRVWLRSRLVVVVAGLLTAAATLLNPYGREMWLFLGETVRLGRPDIEEWGSVLTHPFALGGPWLIVFTLAGVALWRAGRPRRLDYLAIVAILAFASFRVSRLDAFFTLAVVILFGPEVTRWMAVVVERFRKRSATQRTTTKPGSNAGVLVITAVTVAVMLVPASRIITPYASCLTIAGPWVPEAEAGQFIRLNQLKGRLLTWFDWGEYAIWHFGPDLQVSMDGRRETVYTDRTIQAHRKFYAADASAASYLRALNPDYIWLPKRLPVIDMLRTSGWTAVFDGPVSAVFARAGAGPFQSAPVAGSARRCFPGP